MGIWRAFYGLFDHGTVNCEGGSDVVGMLGIPDNRSLRLRLQNGQVCRGFIHILCAHHSVLDSKMAAVTLVKCLQLIARPSQAYRMPAAYRCSVS